MQCAARIGSQVSLERASAFKPARAIAKPVAVAKAVSCSAEQKKQLVSGVAAAALAVAFTFTGVEAAKADIAGLTPCSESKAFAKRKKNEIKALQKRLKQYEAGSAPALALNATIAKAEARFDKYGKQGLLCGTDGLPHLISDPGLAFRYGHTADVFLPTLAFIYFAGWLGYSGSKYLQATKSKQAEIIIDVPLAWAMLWQGSVWPLRAVADLKSGALLAKDSEITVSPR
jgi:photosystem I subunit 3